jgi:uncharacterized protein (TIGR02246 family)
MTGKKADPRRPTMSTSAQAQEIAALEQLVADAERFQNDTEQFVELLTDDYTVVNIAGRRVKGRAEARGAMETALAGDLSRVITRHELTDITFLRPDVALVGCVKHVSDERGDSGDDLASTARLTFVTVKQGDAWRIALAQTTPIAS